MLYISGVKFFYNFTDFVHVWDHTSLRINLLESPLRARTAVLERSSRQEYLILALRLNQSASILQARWAVCGIFSHAGFSTAKEMLWYLRVAGRQEKAVIVI